MGVGDVVVCAITPECAIRALTGSADKERCVSGILSHNHPEAALLPDMGKSSLQFNFARRKTKSYGSFVALKIDIHLPLSMFPINTNQTALNLVQMR